MTTVEEELKYNPRLSKPKSDFVKIMKELNLPYPKQIGEIHEDDINIMIMI